MTDKRRPIAAAQWLAARAVSEGAAPTRRRVAAMLGCDDSAVYGRAAEEDWRRLDFRQRDVRDAHRDFIACAAAAALDDDGALAEPHVPDEDDGRELLEEGDLSPRPAAGEVPAEIRPGDDPVAVLARCASLVARRVSAVIARAEKGSRIHKTEIDALVAMMRMMERWEALAKERVKQEQAQSDEDLAAVLARINDRIVELARGLAAQLVAARGHAG